jgi:hypothetical protein
LLKLVVQETENSSATRSTRGGAGVEVIIDYLQTPALCGCEEKAKPMALSMKAPEGTLSKSKRHRYKITRGFVNEEVSTKLVRVPIPLMVFWRVNSGVLPKFVAKKRKKVSQINQHPSQRN